MTAPTVGEARKLGGRTARSRSEGAPPSRDERGSRDYRVHPSLRPTVFTPSGNAPEAGTGGEVAERTA